MRLKRHLNEIFDTEVEIVKTKQSKWNYTVLFKINGREFEFGAMRETTIDGDDFWSVNFFDEEGDHTLTKKGGQFQVYSSAMQIMKRFIKSVKPKRFVFTAKEASRIKLYDRFAKMIKKESPYNLMGRKRDFQGYMAYVFER